ncbi:pyridoxamine 5'-phosphate oxidase family protein [Mycolicibacterium phlei]
MTGFHEGELAVQARAGVREQAARLGRGMLAIDFASRRRVRVNGTVADADADGLTVAVDQAFGNCPRYIQPRDLSPAQPSAAQDFRRGDTLGESAAAVIGAADTFFLGTEHPSRGADASHRGGPPGFARVAGNTLWWPDYPGNNMFNSLGNLAVDPAAAVLVVDFATGATVQVSGTGAVEWSGTDRRVVLAVEAVVESRRPDLRAVD